MVCIKALRIFAAKISYKHLIFNIMSECKTVTLRTRPLKKGMLSFYLDYYPGYRDQETMKTIRHEGLNIYIYANPKNQRERDFNAAMSEKAEAIRCRRFEAIVNERYDFFDKRKYKADAINLNRILPILILFYLYFNILQLFFINYEVWKFSKIRPMPYKCRTNFLSLSRR